MEKIKETIKYYIVLLYYNTIYLHYMYKVEHLIKGISRCRTREEAMHHSNIVNNKKDGESKECVK